ncbi:transporter [Burkholderia multivorans]|nr:BON domain-containing protein [Burkholderia multivorans]PRG36107.1 transporter [Burkholderia multivorans]
MQIGTTSAGGARVRAPHARHADCAGDAARAPGGMGPLAAHAAKEDTMQRRYPGRPVERRGPPDWQERSERAYRDAGERGFPDDPALRPEEDYESAYRRFASEDVGPEEWGSEWTERAARPAAELGGRGARTEWHGGPGGPGEPRGARGAAYEAERGRGQPGGGPDPHRYGGGRDEAPGLRGHFRLGWYGGGERGYDDPRTADAPDLSRFGSGAARDAMRGRRGPKGYTRSDERIREDVCERLAHALEIDVSDVSVQVSDGRVELDGTVPARWMKHAIEDIADDCMCVRDVENRVRVKREGEHDSGMVLHPAQRTVTPTQPAVREPEPGTSAQGASSSDAGAGGTAGSGAAGSGTAAGTGGTAAGGTPGRERHH